ncbi:MAG: PRC-barrel domain-containing protein [Tepidiformaceae bacterium]
MNTSVLSASTLSGDSIVNASGEDVGKLEDIMLDLDHGKVAYAVLSVGGFMGMGDKLFALPWESLQVDTANKRLICNVPKEKFEASDGFDKSNWPNLADPSFRDRTYSQYGAKPYWN